MKTENVIRGRKSQALGKSFERYFKTFCEGFGIAVTQIPDGCRQVGRSIQRVKTPFDWILTYNGVTRFIDTKTLKSDHYTPSQLLEKPHQYGEILKHKKAGGDGGFVVWLRSTDEMIYVPVNMIYEKKCIVLGTFNRFDPRILF